MLSSVAPDKDWVEEKHQNILNLRYPITERLFLAQSPFQKVEVVKTKGYGNMLLNDGYVMITDRDEFVYHDMIAHIPLFVHPSPHRVLVIGGGDGGTAREVLRHGNVKQVDMVEIDAMVVDVSRKYFPKTAAGMKENPRFELTIADAVEYVAVTDRRYDVVLVDSTDPIGPATPLFGKEFYNNVARVLNEDGIVVSQAESPFYEQERQNSMLSILNQIFPIAKIYNYSNMTYPGGTWSFTFGSKKYHPLDDYNEERVVKSDLKFDYYNSDIHRASFALPEFMKRNIAGLE